MNIDVGCGERPYEDGSGWVHLDERSLDHVEYVGKAEDLLDIVGPNTCHRILARHILEHFSFLDTQTVLKNWLAALVPGGHLRVEVPNFAWQTKAHFTGEISDAEAVDYVYGAQTYDGNFHKNGFTVNSLRQSLLEAGFAIAETMDIGQVVVANAYKDC